jgi:hypothetical protein
MVRLAGGFNRVGWRHRHGVSVRQSRARLLRGRSIGERTGGPLQALRVRVGMTKGDKGFRPLNHEPSLSSSGSLCAVGVIPQGTRRVSAGGGRAAAWRKVGSAII